MGIRNIDLNNIISPDANLADFPTIQQKFKWGSTFLSSNELLGTGFEDLSLEEKMMVVESFDIIIGEDMFNPTIIPNMVNIEPFIDEIEGSFDQTTRMVSTDEIVDITKSAAFYKTLDRLGVVDRLYDDEHGVIDIVETINYDLEPFPLEDA